MPIQVPEKAALIALAAVQHVADSNNYRAQVDLLMEAMGEVMTKEILPNAELSTTMMATVVCDYAATLLSRSVATMADSLTCCPTVLEEGKEYGDLFRRAVVDFLLESIADSMRQNSSSFLLSLDERAKAAGVKK